MQKAHSRIFIINSNDFANELILGLRYSEAQARAYVESVCQVPFHQPDEVAYSVADHPRPEVGSHVNVLNSVWFDNSWKGNSWRANIDLVDGGPPCFWTKASHDAVDVMSSAYAKYNKKYPNRGWKIGLDRYSSYVMVLRQLQLFFETFPSEEKHIWIQGDVEGLNTTQLMLQLREDIFKEYASHVSTSAATDPQVVRFWNTPVGLSFGPSYIYGGRPAQRIPIVPWRPSNFGSRVYGGVTVPQIFPPTRLRSERRIEIDIAEKSVTKQEPVVYANYSGFVTLKAMANPSEYDFGWQRVADNRYIMVDTKAAVSLDFIDGDALVTWPEADHFWESGDYTPHQSRADFDLHCYNMFVAQMNRNESSVILFNGGTAFAQKYGAHIKGVVTVSRDAMARNMSARIASGNVSQPTDVRESMTLQAEYLRLRLREFHGFDTITEPGLYMAASGTGKTTFVGSSPYAHLSGGKQLYTVSDPTFFNGLGSVCTSAHAVFALGRRERDLVFQTRRRMLSGHDTSGHMLAAPLMYLSHMLWYLQEVSDNFESEASIYNLRFKEPTRGLYHTTQEYKNALNDMRHSLAEQYPFYARQNIDICERFVKSLGG